MAKQKVYKGWPCRDGDVNCIKNTLEARLSERLAEVYNSPESGSRQSVPADLCYEVGDQGPGGGIVFATPHSSYSLNMPGNPPQLIHNNTDFYWEVAKDEIAKYGFTNDNYPSFMLTTGCCEGPLSTGLAEKCEFGNATPSNLGTPGTLDWHLGAGEINTALLNNLPSGGSTVPPNPTCDTHGLASQKVNTYVTVVNSNTYGDWFIPSTAEALLLLSNFHSLPIANNYTSPMYHTSSDLGLGAPVEWAVGINLLGSTLNVTKKCHPLGVIAIRKFKCDPESYYPECFDHSNILNDNWQPGDDWYGKSDCIEYNYKHGNCGYTAGSFCIQSGTSSNLVTVNNIHYWNYGLQATYNAVSPYSSSGQFLHNQLGNGIIGTSHAAIKLSSIEAKGRVNKLLHFALNSRMDITLWDRNRMFLGKWKANIISVKEAGFNEVETGTSGVADQDYILEIILNNITHLQGDYPILDFTPDGSSLKTWSFAKFDWPNNLHTNFALVQEFENAHGVGIPAIVANNPADVPYMCGPYYWNPSTTYCHQNYLIDPLNTYYQNLGYNLHSDLNSCSQSNNDCFYCCGGASLRMAAPSSGSIYHKLDSLEAPADASKVEEYNSKFPAVPTSKILDRQGTNLPSYIRDQTGGTTPTGKVDPGLLGDKLQWDIITKEPMKVIGCAQEYNNDPNSPNYGCYHKPKSAATPLGYHINNSGCPNQFGLPHVNNIDCCECDIIVGLPKWHPGSVEPLLDPIDVRKYRFGCAQHINTDPTSQYYNWVATNYNSLNEGCNTGFGYPDPNNTDCCNWDLIVGIP